MAVITVTDWNSFITAVGTAGAEVEFPHSSQYLVKTHDRDVDANKLYLDSNGVVQTNVQPSDLADLYENTFVLDANDYAREGLSTTISIACDSINGYGGYIKNLASYDVDIFTNNYSGADKLIITQLAILNFNVENHNFMNSRYMEWEYCIFSGRAKNNSLNNSQVLTVFGDSSQTINQQFTSCSFNLTLDGQVNPFEYYYIPYDYYGTFLIDCRVEIHKTNNENSYGGRMIVVGQNSYFTGDVDRGDRETGGQFEINFTNQSIYSITEISETDTNAISFDYSGNISYMLINTDLLPSGAYIPGRYTQVTDTTLSDANALSALGFPIQT